MLPIASAVERVGEGSADWSIARNAARIDRRQSDNIVRNSNHAKYTPQYSSGLHSHQQSHLANLMSDLVRDHPAVAEAIVVHAKAICEREDQLWDVVGELSIPTDCLTDPREQHKVDFGTAAMIRAFLYQHVRGFSRNKLSDHLAERPTLVKRFGFDTSQAHRAPTQQCLNDVWTKFSEDTQNIIRQAAAVIANLAVEHDIIAEVLVPTLPPDEDDEDHQSCREYKKEKSRKSVRLARKHVLPEFNTERAPHRTYPDDVLWDMFARMCANTGSAHSESEYGWLTDHDLTCADSTFLRAIKKAATPASIDAAYTHADFADHDLESRISVIREEVMAAFDGATDNVINSIRGEDPFDDRRTVAAIDITYQQFHVWPWENKDDGIPKPDFPGMVSGYTKDGAVKRGYKFATITLVGEHAPIILGIEPVKEDSIWETDDAPSFSKGELVDRLLARAQRFVDLDEVFLDRGFYGNEVYAAIDDRDLLYTTPVPMYTDDYEIVEGIEDHPTADVAVNHDVAFGYEGVHHHSAEFLYAPVAATTPTDSTPYSPRTGFGSSPRTPSKLLISIGAAGTSRTNTSPSRSFSRRRRRRTTASGSPRSRWRHSSTTSGDSPIISSKQRWGRLFAHRRCSRRRRSSECSATSC